MANRYIISIEPIESSGVALTIAELPRIVIFGETAEDALGWAAEHEVRWIDIQLDAGANALSSFDDARAAGVRRACERYGVHLGLHTASAVNVAEVAPYVGDAVERYLEAYVEIAPRLGAEWIVMHAGFHFTSDKERRMAAGLERLKRIVGHAERHGALVLLENLNKEPDEAEIHYLAHTIEEWRYYFDAIQSPAFKLSFTANHAHLVPEGIAGFVEPSIWAGWRRCGWPIVFAMATRST